MADEILAGRLTVDTSEFTRKITEAVNKANAQIAKVGKEKGGTSDATKAIKDQEVAVNKLITTLQRQMEVSKQAFQKAQVNEVTQAYKRLTTGVSEYNRAVKAHDTQGKQYWSNQIASAKQYLDGVKANINQLDVEETQRRKILDTITKSDTAYKNLMRSQSQSVQITQGLAQQWDKIYGIIKLISGISLYKIFGEALSYAKEFNAALTDISVITTGTRIDAEALGVSYRKMANDLRVTSTEIAKANATIFRQGFQDPNQAAAITRGATKFGAVTGIGTNSAIQNMTAAIQNFYKEGEDIGQFVEHLGDVWSYMGDKVATTGSEISEAMSKTAASVNSVGVSMEQASAWAAIMLANTQQAGNVIGTQMNSLIARYAKVTSKGYAAVTSDDEGEALSFNDVSKALREVGIEMYDVASKSFLPMNEMMDQLADKWGSLDEAQKKYIATTLGGTRGMNYLLTLLDNYNDAVELQEGIIDGIVNSKYEAWMQGVEAAQNNLTNSMENLYAYLSSDVLTGFYNKMAGVVDIFTAATDAVGGLNLKIPAIVAGVLALVSAAMKLKEIFTAGNGLLQVFSGGSIGLIAGGIFAAISAIGGIISAFSKAKPDIDYVAKRLESVRLNTERANSFADMAAKYSDLAESLKEIGDVTNDTAINSEEFDAIRKAIVADSPTLQKLYGQEGEKIRSLAEAYGLVTDEANKAREAMWAVIRTGREDYRKAYEDTVNGYASDAERAAAGLSTQYSTRGQITRIFENGNRDRQRQQLRDVFAQEPIWVLENYIEEIQKQADATRNRTDKEFYEEVIKDAEAALVTAQDAFDDAKETLLRPWLETAFSAETTNALINTNGSIWESLIDSILSKVTPHTNTSALEKSFKPLGETYANILANGMTDATMASLQEALQGFTDETGIKVDPLDELIKAWDSTMTLSAYHGDVGEQFANAIFSGDISGAVLKRFNDEVAAIREEHGTSAYGPIHELMQSILGMTEDELEEYGQIDADVDVDITPVIEDEEDLPSKIRKKIEDILSQYSATGVTTLEQYGEWAENPRSNPTMGIIDVNDLALLAQYYEQYQKIMAMQEQASQYLPEDMSIDDAQESYEHLRELYELRTRMEESAKNGGNILDYSKELTEEGIYGATSLEEGILAVGEAINSIQSPLQDFFDWLGVSFEDTNTEIYETIARFGELGATISGVKADQDEYRKSVEDLIHPMNDVEKAVQTLRSGHRLEIDEVGDLIKKYPDLADELSEYGRDTKNTTKLVQELNKHIANDAMNEWANSVESAVKKLDGLESGTREYSNAMVELSNSFDFQGLGTLSNLDFVTQNLDNIRAAAYGSVDAFHALQEAAWVNIFGTSSVDFSNIQNGIALVGENAERLAQILVSLGYFEVETQQVTSAQEVISGIQVDQFGGVSLQKQTVTMGGTYQILKPSSSNPFSGAGFKKSSGSGGSGGGGSGKKGGGGGGGGGSSTIKVSDSTKTLLDDMTKVQDEIDNKLKLIDLKREFHSIRGEIQGVIAYTKLEAETLKDQNVILESNIAKLKEQIDEKQAIIDKNKNTSTAYKQAAKDLEELNKAHKTYTEQLQKNINRIEGIRLEIEKFREEARQTTISVQKLIRDTLEAKRKYERDMLDGTVTLEDKIVEIIRNRYERERDLILKTSETRKDALQTEIDEIDELIKAREKLLNKEKESEEIAELQAKIARISADPTRRKEMMELQSQLAEKQKQQAWDTYEEELQAQKDSLNKQIDNIDDYMDYVNEYYEDLFEHPKKLIAEMREIIKQSDSEIIEWLKANTEEWSDYTEAKMQQTEEDWQEMINTMRGVTETYQKEIEEIMSWTNEEIITWLKQNNVDFQTATKEQQDSFLYTWKQTLTDWRNAYKSVVAEVNATQYSTPSYSVGGGGGGGGSYGGGGGGGYYGGGSSVSAPTSSTSTYATPSANTSLFTAAAAPPKTYTGHATYYYVGGSGKTIKSKEQTATSTVSYADAIKKAKEAAMNYAKNEAISSWNTYRKANAGAAKDWNTYTTAYRAIIKDPPDKKYVWLGNAYKKGGIIDYTGPAWVDGSKGVPERILTGEQNALFESLVATLQEIKRVSVPGFNGGTDNAVGFAGRGLVIEQINIQTQNLDSDADFDYIAERVGESIMSGLQRTMPTGGIKTF